MPEKAQKDLFLEKLRESAGALHKVIAIYADSRQDREDLYQEIVFQAWKSFPAFRHEATFSTWIYRVALNTALVFRKKENRHRTNSLDEIQDQAEENAFFISQEQKALMAAIKSLEKVDRLIISLHLEGYQNNEIAKFAGISKENTAVKIHRIKKVLTKKLKEE